MFLELSVDGSGSFVHQSSVKRHGVTFEKRHQNRKLVIISLKITNSTSVYKHTRRMKAK